MKKLAWASATFVVAASWLQSGEPVPEALSDISLKQLPAIALGKYQPDPYLSAAATLQTAGKEKGGETLRRLCKQAGDLKRGDQVIVLCRMLYAAKPGREFRRPRLGGPVFLGGTALKDWPAEPIVLVDGVPFLVVRGYVLAGEPERPEDYVDYCMRNCDWRTERFAPKSSEEKQKALAKLLASPKWKQQLGDREKEFLSRQID